MVQPYYPMRHVPHTIPSSVLYKSLRGIARPLVRSAVSAGLYSIFFYGDSEVRRTLEERSRLEGDLFMNRVQHVYFDNPGLDSLTVRRLTKTGRNLAYLGARLLHLQVLLGLDREGRAERNLRFLPQTGYDAIMVAGISVGEAMGYFRGGSIFTHLWWDSDAKTDVPCLPEGHPIPIVRRFDAPRTLKDLGADIDDLYWATAYGQSIKVTRVGEGQDRRWLVSLPGTDHANLASTPNAADIEANFREEMNLPNAMRQGAMDVIRASMEADGIAPEDMVHEKVLICGHSQGGMIAVALASLPPEQVGFTVDRVLTLGSPTRRLHLRDDVQAIAVEHDQDIVPSLDGTPRRSPDQRVIVRRSLHAPKYNPLYYAHASSTYTETLRQLERRAEVVPWGREAKTVEALQAYLPKPGEPTRVFHLYTWREVSPPSASRHKSDIFDVNQLPDWEPVRYETDLQINEDLARGIVPRVADLAQRFPELLADSVPVALGHADPQGKENEGAEKKQIEPGKNPGTGDPPEKHKTLKEITARVEAVTGQPWKHKALEGSTVPGGESATEATREDDERRI